MVDPATGKMRAGQLFAVVEHDPGRGQAFAIEAARSDAQPLNPCQERRLATARAWQRANDVRHRYFDDGETLFVDPAWAILLYLYIEGQGAPRISVSRACRSSKLPPSTALRWIQRLQVLRLVVQTIDPGDAGRLYITLTDKALDRMGAVLDAAFDDHGGGAGQRDPIK